MATGKVARRTVVSDVAALLDSPELSALIAELDALRWTGRRGFGARALLGACLVKSLFGLPTWTFVAALIAEHPGLQAAIGGNPSVWAMYRFTRKLQAWAFVLAAIGRLAPLVTPRRLARFWSGLPVKDALQRGDHIDCASEARLITELTEAAERQMARIRRGLGQSIALSLFALGLVALSYVVEKT